MSQDIRSLLELAPLSGVREGEQVSVLLMNLQTKVGELKRVGPKTAELLNSKGIYTAADLVCHYPSRYEKYVSLTAVSGTQENETCAVLLTVIGKGSSAVRAAARSVISGPETPQETFRLTYYNMPYMVKNLPPGQPACFYGGHEKDSQRTALYGAAPGLLLLRIIMTWKGPFSRSILCFRG